MGRSSGGTAAGESIIAATMGDSSTMVSALLTVKNAGNRGGQGASGGSSLAKFEFNNGTAFEIDQYGRRTLQYQPGCKISIDSNGTGGGNHAQTGRTIVPFNSTFMVIILETITIFQSYIHSSTGWKISSYFIYKCHW